MGDSQPSSPSQKTVEEREDAAKLHASQIYNDNPTAISFACRALVHSWRTLGYVPWLTLALKKYPRHVILAMLSYYTLRFRTKWWNDEVHRFLKYSSSPIPRALSANTVPYDKNKQYVVTIHPHGVLACGWFNLLSRYLYDDNRGSSFKEDGSILMNGIPVYLCFAPVVQLLPFHGEIYQGRGTDVSAKTLRRVLKETNCSVALAPGGFSELVYAGYRENEEVAFILGRYGFVKVALEHGLDLVPVYTFGLNKMYWLPDWQRHRRAVLSQRLSLPVTMFAGKWGTAVPFTEDTVTVTFNPFPMSGYRKDQVKEAHRDYCVYLKKCFDEYKHVTEATKNCELVFAGRDQVPARL